MKNINYKKELLNTLLTIVAAALSAFGLHIFVYPASLEIKNDIIYVLKHGATIVESKGMFTNEGSSIIISVVNIRQIPEFLKITKKYPDTFVYYSDVTGVNGNFRWFKDDVAK